MSPGPGNRYHSPTRAAVHPRRMTPAGLGYFAGPALARSVTTTVARTATVTCTASAASGRAQRRRAERFRPDCPPAVGSEKSWHCAGPTSRLRGPVPTLTVRGTIKTERGKGLYLKPTPKSDASVRTIVLPGFAVTVQGPQPTRNRESQRPANVPQVKKSQKAQPALTQRFRRSGPVHFVGLTGFEPATPCPSARAATNMSSFADTCADLRKHLVAAILKCSSLTLRAGF